MPPEVACHDGHGADLLPERGQPRFRRLHGGGSSCPLGPPPLAICQRVAHCRFFLACSEGADNESNVEHVYAKAGLRHVLAADDDQMKRRATEAGTDESRSAPGHRGRWQATVTS